MATQILPQERLKQLLSYDPVTGNFTWRIAHGRAKVGVIAGSHHSNGYVVISIDSKLYRAHRLVWLYMYGAMPVKEIDHINRVKHDNRLSNLRDADRFINTQNTGLQRNNVSGTRGVGWNTAQQKWRARISIAGKTKLLGRFDTFSEACSAYSDAAKTYHAFRED